MTTKPTAPQVTLSDEQLETLARSITKALEPYAALRGKKMLRPSHAALVYDVSEDYLRKQPVDLLPRVRNGTKLTLYPVDALDQLFQRYLIRG